MGWIATLLWKVRAESIYLKWIEYIVFFFSFFSFFSFFFAKPCNPDALKAGKKVPHRKASRQFKMYLKDVIGSTLCILERFR